MGISAAYTLSPGDSILIRPDGNVGAIVGVGQGETVARRLARALPN